MAQAVALQSEILLKDVVSIDTLWVDAHKSQDRYQTSYFSRLQELIEAAKRKQSNQQAVGPRQPETAVNEGAAEAMKTKKKKDHNRNINEG